MNLTEVFSGIATAIRDKDGSSTPIPAEEFAARIAAIPSGSAVVTGTFTGDGSTARPVTTTISGAVGKQNIVIIPDLVSYTDNLSIISLAAFDGTHISCGYLNNHNRPDILEFTWSSDTGTLSWNDTSIFNSGIRYRYFAW